MNASASLPDDAELLKDLLLAERAESERLRQTTPADAGQIDLWPNECEGLCGV